MVERGGRETLNLKFTGSIPIRSKVLLNRGLFLFFLISLSKAAFFLVLASVCEMLETFSFL